jgi:hypothetical protein
VADVAGTADHRLERALMEAEDAGWTELRAVVDSLTEEEAQRPGYFVEGWSAKDALGHIGSWLAAAGAVLERIRAGTYRREEIDVEALNATFLERMRDLPLETVRSQAMASRARMLVAWRDLETLTPEAAFWVGKAGAQHYAEHLPRLREWVAELRADRG